MYGRRCAWHRAWPAALVAVLALLAVPLGPLDVAVAAPGITATKTADGESLAGALIDYTLTVRNPASNPDATAEFNVSFRDQLAPGLTYVGPTTPASAGEPTVTTDAVTGAQTLVWSNVNDLSVSSTLAIHYTVRPDPAVYPVGSVVSDTAAAYASTDPFTVPTFDDDGVLVPDPAVQQATTNTTTTTMAGVAVTKSEPSPEGELLRGVHDHTTVYTLHATTSTLAGSDDVVLVDYLPAALELLGCGGVDNSAAREYPGAPSLAATPAPPGCRQPDAVSTVVNPPPTGSTTYAPGTYTRVEWDLGDLPANADITIRYAAGVPLRANVAWTAPVPAGAAQIANLDNNTGPSTRETLTERSATNTARIDGTYTGPLAPGASARAGSSDTETVSLEDLRIRKSVSPVEFTVDGVATYTVTVDTGEYTSASDVVLTDTIPDGVCPLGYAGTNYSDAALAACAGSAATAPTGATFDDVTQNDDGTFTVVLSPLALDPSGTTTITYRGRMLPTYLSNGNPTAAGDTFTNVVRAAGTSAPIAGTGEAGDEAVADSSSATQTTGALSIDKLVAPRSASSGTCPTSIADYGEPGDLPAAETALGRGDRICFALVARFPARQQTRNPQVTDYLPPGFSFLAGSARPADEAVDAPFTVASGATTVRFAIGANQNGGRYVPAGAVFATVLQAQLTQTPTGTSPVQRSNLMKLVVANSSNSTQSFRDSLALTVVPVAPMGVVKGVQAVDDPAFGPADANSDQDGIAVHEGSRVTFRVDLTNLGTSANQTDYPIGGADVWDVLPVQLDCSDVDLTSVRTEPVVSPGPTVTCTDPGDDDHPTFAGSSQLSLLRVRFPSVTADDVATQGIDPGDTLSVLYTSTVRTPSSLGTTLRNTAYVHSYQSVTNAGTPATFYPKSNVDTSLPAASQDAPAASDPSWVVVPSATVTKTATTSVDEQNNNAASQATVGETIDYTYAVQIPRHTSAYSGVLSDSLPTGIQLVPGTARVDFVPDATDPATTADVPDGVSLDETTGALRLSTDGPGYTYSNSTDTDQVFRVTVTTLVTTAALSATANNQVRTNTAQFVSLESVGGSARPPTTDSVSVTLRQPNVVLTKSASETAPVPGGTSVTYMLRVANQNANGTATNRPPLHDAQVQDCVPAGLVVTDPGAGTVQPTVAPCAPGETRLTWSVGTVAAGAPVTLTYVARTPTSAPGGTTYTNRASVTGWSVEGGTAAGGARSYTATATTDVQIVGAAVTKTVTPSAATIGQRVTWRVSMTIPANTAFYAPAIVDKLPAGFGDLQILDVDCRFLSTPTTDCTTGVSQLTPVPQPDGSTLYAALFSDSTGDVDARQITLTFDSVLRDVPSSTAGTTWTNTATSHWNTTPGTPPTSAGATWTVTGGQASAAVRVLEPSLSASKSVVSSTPAPADTFRYRIRVMNAAGSNRSTAYSTVVRDVVPAGVVVHPDSISEPGVLTDVDPLTGGGTITWTLDRDGDGIQPGGFTDLTYTAELAPSAQLTTAALVNTASVPSYRSLFGTGRTYAGPSTTANVRPQFPHLTTTKSALTAGPAYIGEPFTWNVRLTNDGTARAYAIGLTDTLPVGWEYVPGSSLVTLATGDPVALEPEVDGRTLTWTSTGLLDPGVAGNLRYQARPTEAVVDEPGVGSDVDQVDTAQGYGEDATTATANKSGSYIGPPSTAVAHIDAADLAITKTHATPVVAGGRATWTLTATNAGDDPAVGPFTVTDTLPAGVGLVSASGSGWTCVPDDADQPTAVTCTRGTTTTALAKGASFPVVTVVTSVPADTAAGTEITNTASVQGRTYDPVPANDTTTDTATVTASADLAMTKSHTGTATAGDPFTWTLDVSNEGPSDSQPTTTVTDTLATGTTFVSAGGEGWDCAADGQLVTCTRDALLAAGDVAPQIALTVDVDPSSTGTLENSATVEATTPDPVTSNDTGTDRVTVGTSADLRLEKSHEGRFVAGADATYVFTVDNFGPSDAAAPVAVTDELPDGLSFTDFESRDGTWGCDADDADVTCTLAGDLAAGDQATVAITVHVTDDLGAGFFLNEATVSSVTPDPVLSNNTDDDNSSFTSETDLSIVKSHDGDVTAGSTFDWTLAVHNGGPSVSPGTITVTDSVTAAVDVLSATGTGWTCSADVGDDGRTLVTCDRSAALDSGADAPDIVLHVEVHPDAGPSTITNTATVDGPLTDPDTTNNGSTDEVTIVDGVNVRLTKTADDTDPVVAGTSTSFTLTVRNEGPSDADSVRVVDDLPAGLTATAASGDGWDCDVAGTQVVCTRDTLAATESGTTTSTIDVTARVGSAVPDGTTLTNEARVSTSTPGDDPDDDADEADVDVVAHADLSLTKTHDAADEPAIAGQDATFDIDVHNAGPSVALGPFTVVDTLPSGTTYVSSDGPWTCTPAADGETVTCVLSDVAALAADAHAPGLSITVSVDADDQRDAITNTATVSSATTDPTPDDNTDDDTFPVARLADLSVTKVHDAPARVGDELTWTIGVTNAGPSDAAGVTLRDSLPDGVTFVSATGDGWDCTVDDGVVTCTLADPLAPGATADPVALVVTVEPAAFPAVTNTVHAATTTHETALDDNDASDGVPVPAQVDLSITKTHHDDFVVGSGATWDLVVHNAGPTPDSLPATVTDVLPPGTTYVAARSDDGIACTADGRALTCTVPALGVDASARVAVDVTVGAAAYPAVVNTATVSTPSEDLDPDDNTATDTAPVTPLSALAVDKSVTDQDGRDVTYRIGVTNTGPNATTLPVVVTDPAPEGLRFASVAGDDWNCTRTPTLITCTYAGAVAVGKHAPDLTVTGRLTADAGAEVDNVATASGACPVCDPVSDDAAATVPVSPSPTPSPAPTDQPSTGLPPGPGAIATTGFDAWPAGLVALLLVAVGASAAAVRRRRT